MESLYGWASAQLFVQALQNAGNPPTRAGLEAALDKITSFNASGLLPTANPAQNIPGDCAVLAQVQNGHDRPGRSHPGDGVHLQPGRPLAGARLQAGGPAGPLVVGCRHDGAPGRSDSWR